MSRVNRVGLVVAVVVALVPATAHAATPARTPAETARAYVAALERHDIQDACALLDSSRWTSRRGCRATLAEIPAFRRVRIEPGALTRGTRARVVVGLVADDSPGPPRVSRSRVLLRRIGGRWRIVAAGGPLAVGMRDVVAPDPAPAGAAAALRRLADDELLALSGNGSMLCGLLARGAPLGGSGGGCARVALYDILNDGAGRAARLARFAARVTAPGRARLDITAVGTWAVRSARRPGYALRSRRWSDTLFAVRSGGRWKLVKPSRSLYLALGVPAPADVGSPSQTAVWPGGEAVPSLSERAAPGCETPSALWAMTCWHFDGLASGAGLVAWSAGYAASARPVGAGVAAGPMATVAPLDRPARRLWSVTGVAPAGDGALVIETGFGDPETRAIPVGRDGRPSGPAQLVDDGVTDGSTDSSDGSGAVVVPMPAGVATATVLTATGQILRLGADGRPTGPAGTLAEDLNPSEGLLAGRADGTLLWFAAGKDGAGLAVTALDASGNPVGAPVSPPGGGTPIGSSLAAAEDAAGHVLVGWIEDDGEGRRTLRTWVYDPGAPGSSAPVPRVQWTGAGTEGESSGDVAVSALADGGWGFVVSVGPELVGGRLQPSGAWLARPQRVALGFSGTLLGARGFSLTGDTVAWIAPPPVAGLSQVRSAPLP